MYISVNMLSVTSDSDDLSMSNDSNQINESIENGSLARLTEEYVHIRDEWLIGSLVINHSVSLSSYSIVYNWLL